MNDNIIIRLYFFFFFGKLLFWLRSIYLNWNETTNWNYHYVSRSKPCLEHNITFAKRYAPH